jgi:hypothetical protein
MNQCLDIGDSTFLPTIGIQPIANFQNLVPQNSTFSKLGRETR